MAYLLNPGGEAQETAAISDDQGELGKDYEYARYVPEQTDLKEITFKELLIGVIMAMVPGAANA